MKRFICYTIASAILNYVSGQDSTGKLSISGYAEAYYQYDFNKPPSKDRPVFLYNHKRHNEFSINLAYLKAAYTSKKTRANFAVMAGNYPQYNLAAEPAIFQQILEANIGYIISDQWSVDAGILPSHIGVESAISKDCWNLSRSLLAENSPYYETGVKLNYTRPKWSFSMMILNGWQNIRETNSGKAIGTQIQFRPDKKWLINVSHFMGNEKPDSLEKAFRFFQNLYITYAAGSRFNAAILFDWGTEIKNNWYGAGILLQYLPASKIRFGFRAEKYKDAKGVIIPLQQAGGFHVNGFSLNADFIPLPSISFRVEGRYLQAANSLFNRNNNPVKNNCSLLASLAVGF